MFPCCTAACHACSNAASSCLRTLPLAGKGALIIRLLPWMSAVCCIYLIVNLCYEIRLLVLLPVSSPVCKLVQCPVLQQLLNPIAHTDAQDIDAADAKYFICRSTHSAEGCIFKPSKALTRRHCRSETGANALCALQMVSLSLPRNSALYASAHHSMLL